MTKLFGRAKKLCSAFAIAAAIGVSATPMPAHAITVWDPTNFVQNLITATNAVLTEANTYSTMIESTKQTQQMMRNVSNLNGLGDIAGVGEELAMYQQLASNAMQLYQVMNQAKSLYTDLQSQYGASGFTWKTFLQTRSNLTAVRSQNIMSQLSTVNQSLQQVSQRRAALLQRAQDAGMNESMMQVTQVVSGQLDMISGQNQQVISMMANKMANEETDKTERAKSEEVAEKMNREYQDRLRSSAEALH